MSFDFLGTMYKDQWIEFSDFVNQCLADVDEKIKFLKYRVKVIEKFVSKLRDIDSRLGGTSKDEYDKEGVLRVQFSSDARKAQEYSSANFVSGSLGEFLSQNRLVGNSDSKVAERIGGEKGTICGGDFVWLDLPLAKGLYEPGEQIDDSVSQMITSPLKTGTRKEIYRRRENLEFKLKRLIAYRESLLMRIWRLQNLSQGASATLDIMKNLFLKEQNEGSQATVDPGDISKPIAQLFREVGVDFSERSLFNQRPKTSEQTRGVLKRSIETA